MKQHVGLILSVTVFLSSYLCLPSNACIANPTNYFSVCEGHGNKSDWQLLNEWVYHSVPVSEAKIVPIVDERAPTQSEDKIFGPIIFFVIILAVAAYIIYQLIKLLDKVIPPPDQPPPPPNAGDTNRPPITINPTHGPGPAIATLSAKNLTVTSNTPSWGTIQCYDISALHYQDTVEKFQVPVYYDRFWSAGMQSSTNLVDWQDTHYRVDCYINVECGAVCYAYFHYGTNWWNCYYTSAYVTTNHVAPAWIELSDGPRKPNQFFRLDPK